MHSDGSASLFPNRSNAFFSLHDSHINHVLDVIKKRKEKEGGGGYSNPTLIHVSLHSNSLLWKVTNIFITPNLQGAMPLRAKLIMIIMKREKIEGKKKLRGEKFIIFVSGSCISTQQTLSALAWSRAENPSLVYQEMGKEKEESVRWAKKKKKRDMFA